MDKNDIAITLYKGMKKIRMSEERIGLKFQEQEMKTPMHLSLGQEAIAVGVCQALTKEDVIYSNHRGHGHYIAKGGNLDKLIAELYNKEGGCSRGRGGSMHIIDNEAGVGMTSSIVSGNVPIATGEAMAFKMMNSDRVAVTFFGDGASEEGCVYESICYAALHKLPILYICENNEYAMYTTLDKREPTKDIAMKFQEILPTFITDGNDVEQVFKITQEATERARNGVGPTFLEFRTYRYANHYETKGGDPLGFRPKEEYERWKQKCPIQKYERILLGKNLLNEVLINMIEEEINSDLDKAFKYAMESELPKAYDVHCGLWG
jgi:pyruvate dehydrogenase E1 component alpha subunit